LKDVFTTHQQTVTLDGKSIRITIPAGIEDGQKIRLKGYGAPGRTGTPNGDLYITFHVEESPGFKRVGNDLYTTVVIDLYTAVLGGEITVDTVTGKLKLRVAAGTQNNGKVRLKNKGVPVYKQKGTLGTYTYPTTFSFPPTSVIKRYNCLKNYQLYENDSGPCLLPGCGTTKNRSYKQLLHLFSGASRKPSATL
jgi:curved DNA-binding protein